MWLAGEAPDTKVLPGVQKKKEAAFLVLNHPVWATEVPREQTVDQLAITTLDIFLRAYQGEQSPSPHW